MIKYEVGDHVIASIMGCGLIGFTITSLCEDDGVVLMATREGVQYTVNATQAAVHSACVSGAFPNTNEARLTVEPVPEAQEEEKRPMKIKLGNTLYASLDGLGPALRFTVEALWEDGGVTLTALCGSNRCTVHATERAMLYAIEHGRFTMGGVHLSIRHEPNAVVTHWGDNAVMERDVEFVRKAVHDLGIPLDKLLPGSSKSVDELSAIYDITQHGSWHDAEGEVPWGSRKDNGDPSFPPLAKVQRVGGGETLTVVQMKYPSVQVQNSSGEYEWVPFVELELI